MMPEPSYYQQLFLRRIKREKQLIVLWRTAVFSFCFSLSGSVLPDMVLLTLLFSAVPL